MRKLYLAVCLLFAVRPAHAAYVRVLLPLYIAHPVQGAYGSVWQSELVIHSGSTVRSYVIEPCAPTQGCPIDLRTDEELVPGETQTGLPARYPVPANPVAGATLWLLPEAPATTTADEVAFGLRVVDTSRTATAAGTDIPVVRESEFRTGTIHLLNVPVDTRFRTALRIFEMNLAQADFTVRIFDETNETLLSEQKVTTTTGGVAPGGFTPAFAQLPDFANGAPTARLRVEIEPITPGVAFWSYVSITNNDSQQITLVTPQ